MKNLFATIEIQFEEKTRLTNDKEILEISDKLQTLADMIEAQVPRFLMELGLGGLFIVRVET